MYNDVIQQRNPWPHAPPHKTLEAGTYMVTSGTYQKILRFSSSERLQFLHTTLLELAHDYGWKLQAWSVFANHYHFIAQSPANPKNLPTFLSHLHVKTARHINALDGTLNRRVWYEFWDSRITYQYSYLARLNYVMQNPVRHGLVKTADAYPWCSASWFEKNTDSSFYKTVRNFKTDRVSVVDDF